MVDAFAVMLQDQLGDTQTDRQVPVFQVMSRQTDRVLRVWSTCRCAKLDINPCHQIDMSNIKQGLNPVFVLGAVMDKGGISIT